MEASPQTRGPEVQGWPREVAVLLGACSSEDTNGDGGGQTAGARESSAPDQTSCGMPLINGVGEGGGGPSIGVSEGAHFSHLLLLPLSSEKNLPISAVDQRIQCICQSGCFWN